MARVGLFFYRKGKDDVMDNEVNVDSGWYYLSFADDVFHGACLVKGTSFMEAVEE